MFRHLVPCLALIAACGAEPAGTTAIDLDPLATAQAAPPGVYGIQATPMVVGRPFTLRITGVNPGQRAFIFRAPRIQAGGFCPAPIAPDCLDLPQAQATNQFNAVANPSGVVTLSVTLPSTLGAPQVAWQGVSPAIGGGGNTSPAILLPVHQLNSDLDGDLLTAQEEVDLYGTDPGLADSDEDGLDDGDEIILGTDPLDGDSDADGLLDGEEVNTYGTDPLDGDSDNDTLGDEVEVAIGTDPLDEDSDNDGLNDAREVNAFLTDPNDPDTDNDGLFDGEEADLFGTNPNVADTDGGSVSDGDEILNGTDPLNGGDDVGNTVLGVNDLGVGDLVITEIMQNPITISDNNGEYFELVNLSGSTVDLVGLVVSDDGSDSFTVNSSLVIPNGGYAVFVLNGDPALNGGIAGPNVYDYASFSLGNADDEVVISNATIDIDAVRYDGGPAFPDPNGASMNLDPSYTNELLNDVAINWCAAPGVNYAPTELGTPGAPNVPCPTVTFTARVGPLLQSRCAGCHVGGQNQGGVNFDVYANMFLLSPTVPGLPLIAPGSVTNSYLLYKLNGTQAAVGGGGAQMPLGGALPQYLIDVVTRWVEQGAQQ
jgi:hypothetical protein